MPPAESAGEQAPRRLAVRRFAPLLLVAGGLAAAVTLAPHLPKERRVELRLEQGASVVEVDVTFAKSRDGEPVHGNAWHFKAGDAPSSLTTVVNLPDDKYEVDITVRRLHDRQSIHRVIAVGDSDQIAIPIP